MSSGDSHLVRNGVIATVIGGVILAVLAELWPPFKGAIAWLWEKVQAFAGLFGESYSVPGWALALLGLLSLVTLMRGIVGLRSNPTAPHNGYTDDILFGAKWRWSWSGGDISDLWCFCPICDAELVYDDSSANRFSYGGVPQTLFICEHCNRSVVGRVEGGDKAYALGVIGREIRRKVRTEQYAAKHDVG